MSNIAYALILAVSIFFGGGLLSAAQPSKLSEKIPLTGIGTAGLPSCEWLILGPLVSDNKGALENLIKTENGYLSITPRDLNTLPSSEEIAIKAKSVRLPGAIDFRKETGSYIDSDDKSFYCYIASTVLLSDAERVVHCLMGNDGAMELYVNGSLINSSTKSQDGDNPSYPVQVPLQAGKNVIIVKVYARGGRCGFALKYVSNLENAAVKACQGMTFFLKSTILPQGGQNSINLSEGFSKVECHLSVRDSNGRLIHEDKRFSLGQQISLPQFVKPGMFSVGISSGQDSVEESFCVGPAPSVYEEMVTRSRSIDLNDNEQINFVMHCRRIDDLLLPQNVRERDRNWQAKIVNSLSELCSILSRSRIEEPITSDTGLHVAAFRSKIDASVKTYRYYIPNTHGGDDHQFPLVVIMPPLVFPVRAFENSNIVATHTAALELAKVAEKYKVALLWTGYRIAPPSSAPCQLAHFDEALEEMCRKQRIDANRIILLGTCAGGVSAADLIASAPARFSGVIFHDAVLHPIASTRLNSAFKGKPGFSAYLKSSNAFRQILEERLATPILIAHSGRAEEGHGELEESLTFWESAQSRNLSNVDFIRLRTRFGYSNEWDSMFEWASNQRPTQSGRHGFEEKLADAKDVGTVSSFFADKFILVEPTNGTEEQRAAGHEYTENFSETWRNAHFGECIRRTDKEIGDRDIKNENLMLIGGPDINSVWSRLLSGIEFPYPEAQNSLNDFVSENSDVFFIVKIINPANPRKRILLVGLPKTRDFDFSRYLNVWTDGWFRLAIWSKTNSNSAPRLLMIDGRRCE